MFAGINGVRSMPSEDKQRLLDTEVIQSSLSQDSSPSRTRKRTSVKKQDSVWGDSVRDDTNIDVPLPELDFNDPNFLELLREYEKDEGEERSGAKELDALRAQAQRKQGIGQGAAYFMLFGFIVLFVVVINWYNAKQLERLKEEYGLGEERKAQPEFWWKKAAIYTIYVPSYQDSDGDGFGDLNGVRSHIDHLTYLGVDAVLLSSFLESPFDDFGRDVVDFKAVSKKCGTLEDFDLLVKELRVHGIKVVVELVPNHTHRLHRWFSKSRIYNTAANEKYKNYYIWHKGKTLSNGTRVPPNNWLSANGGPAWTYDDTRGEFYYHYYHASLPDLNHRDLHVREEILEVFGYWLDHGADALYIDSVHALYEVQDVYLDEPKNSRSSAGLMDHASLDHIYTEDQSDVHDYYGVWREFVENYSLRSGRRVGIIADVLDDTVTDIIKYYFTGIDLPVCHALVDLSRDCGGRCTHEALDLWLVHIPQGHDAMWTLGGSERGRMTVRRDRLYQSVLNMLAMLLPGASLSYYGDEIGLPSLSLQQNNNKLQPVSEEGARRESARRSWRGFMQWSEKESVPESHKLVNVQAQMDDPTGRSMLQIFHRLTRLRKERSFVLGKLQFSLVNDHILSFMRFAKDGAPYLISLNLGNTTSTDDYTLSSGVTYGKVVLAAVWDQPGDLVEGIEPAEGILPAGAIRPAGLSGKEMEINERELKKLDTLYEMSRNEGLGQEKLGKLDKKDSRINEGMQQRMNEGNEGMGERINGGRDQEINEEMNQKMSEEVRRRRSVGLRQELNEQMQPGISGIKFDINGELQQSGDLRNGRLEEEGGRKEYIREGEKVNLARLTLRPGEGVVVILLMDDVDFNI